MLAPTPLAAGDALVESVNHRPSARFVAYWTVYGKLGTPAKVSVLLWTPGTPTCSARMLGMKLSLARAMYAESFWPAIVNKPPAYRSLPESASARTVPFTPEPIEDQLLPSQMAMLSVTTLVPAITNEPPTYRLVPDTASVFTTG